MPVRRFNWGVVLIIVVAVAIAWAACEPANAANPECRMGVGARAMRRTVWCVTNHENMRAQRPHALYVAWRESGFQAGATNTYSGACGIYQHLPHYWPGRYRTYSPARYAPYGTGCHNGRTNIIVSLLMVKRGGWGPWGG